MGVLQTESSKASCAFGGANQYAVNYSSGWATIKDITLPNFIGDVGNSVTWNEDGVPYGHLGAGR